jgi:pyruvate-formate lyase-activating enzyme
MDRIQRTRMARLLFADDNGVVYDHPALLAAARSGEELLLPAERPIALPGGATLTLLPGRLPVGYDPATGGRVVLERVKVGRRTLRPHAVGAALPPGYTRTLLPAFASPTGRKVPVLTQWAYTAAGQGEEGFVAWAIRTDRRSHWSVSSHSTEDLAGRVEALLAESPNPIYRQLARCALEWCCFTAQNTFYARDEGAIPSSSGCNARCVGCLSASDEGLPPASHERIARAPSAGQMAEVAIRHLVRAKGRVMASFGQGCEGEPLTRWREIERAIRLVRAETRRGSLHANTNGSMPGPLGRLVEAGLDSVRVSLNSASPDLYAAWYRPRGYGLGDVERSIREARAKGAYVALNLLTFPGVTDRAGEVERLCALVARTGVDQVQTRPLAVDPDLYVELARGKGAGGPAIGIRRLVAALKRARPGLVVGNFSRSRGERAPRGRGERAARGRGERAAKRTEGAR